MLFRSLSLSHSLHLSISVSVSITLSLSLSLSVSLPLCLYLSHSHSPSLSFSLFSSLLIRESLPPSDVLERERGRNRTSRIEEENEYGGTYVTVLDILHSLIHPILLFDSFFYFISFIFIF